jgi:hypothetical protein
LKAVGIATVLLLALGIAGIAFLLPKKPKTPKEAWELMRERMARKDWDGVFDLYSDAVKQRHEKRMKAVKAKMSEESVRERREIERITGVPFEDLQKMDWRELWVTLMETTARGGIQENPPDRWVFLGESVRGDEAVVRFRTAKGREERAYFVREGNTWKLTELRGVNRIGANEASAIGSLKSICTGEEQFRSGVCIDQNANGVGEYGFLSELGGTAPCRGGGLQYESNPYIPSILGTVDSRGVSHKSGYCFILYLPAGKNAATATDDGRVGVALSEEAYAVYAWPKEKGVTGNRLFFIDVQGQPYGRDDSPYSGPSNPPPWNEAFSDPGKGWSSGIDLSTWKPID